MAQVPSKVFHFLHIMLSKGSQQATQFGSFMFNTNSFTAKFHAYGYVKIFNPD